MSRGIFNIIENLLYVIENYLLVIKLATAQKKVVKKDELKVQEKVSEISAVDRTDEKIERFKRVVGLRVNMVIDKLGNLGKVTENPQNYQFTEEQILLIFGNIEELTADIKRKFLDCISMTDIKEKYKVSL